MLFLVVDVVVIVAPSFCCNITGGAAAAAAAVSLWISALIAGGATDIIRFRSCSPVSLRLLRLLCQSTSAASS